MITDVLRFGRELLDKPPYKLHPVRSNLMIEIVDADDAAVVTRVAKMLVDGFLVYVKTENNGLWSSHFRLCGEEDGYKVYTRGSQRSSFDVQPKRQTIEPLAVDPVWDRDSSSGRRDAALPKKSTPRKRKAVQPRTPRKQSVDVQERGSEADDEEADPVS